MSDQRFTIRLLVSPNHPRQLNHHRPPTITSIRPTNDAPTASSSIVDVQRTAEVQQNAWHLWRQPSSDSRNGKPTINHPIEVDSNNAWSVEH
jgi:hypothetical protein